MDLGRNASFHSSALRRCRFDFTLRRRAGVLIRNKLIRSSVCHYEIKSEAPGTKRWIRIRLMRGSRSSQLQDRSRGQNGAGWESKSEGSIQIQIGIGFSHIAVLIWNCSSVVRERNQMDREGGRECPTVEDPNKKRRRTLSSSASEFFRIVAFTPSWGKLRDQAFSCSISCKHRKELRSLVQLEHRRWEHKLEQLRRKRRRTCGSRASSGL